MEPWILLENDTAPFPRPWNLNDSHLHHQQHQLDPNQTLYNGGGIDDHGKGDEWSPARIQRVITLSILMLVSLVGNSVIIFILICSRYHKQLTRVNVYIINLAVGDLAVCCITMSSELLFEIFQDWKLGNAGCKIIMYTQLVTLSSTTFLLMAMSWDRYKAICDPLNFQPSPSKARRVVFLAWITALVLNLPYFFIYVQVEITRKDGPSVFSCHSAGYTANWQKKLNFIWLTCSVLIFPALWIAYCYYSVARVVWQQGNCQKMASADGFTLLRKTCDIRVIPRAKIKTMKMSLTIVITFIVCWSPYFIVYNIRIFSDYEYNIPESLITVADTLALMNSCADPIIYWVFNLRMRNHETCCFRLNGHSEKSRLSNEQSCSTSSAVRFKDVGRSTDCHTRTKRKRKSTQMQLSNGDAEFQFAQSTRHIQNKRSQTIQRLQAQSGNRQREYHRNLTTNLTTPFLTTSPRKSCLQTRRSSSSHELQTTNPTQNQYDTTTISVTYKFPIMSKNQRSSIG